MFGLGLPEIAIILVVLTIFFFGGEKVTDLARSLGRATGEFKKGKAEIEKELDKVKKEVGSTEEDKKQDVKKEYKEKMKSNKKLK